MSTQAQTFGLSKSNNTGVAPVTPNTLSKVVAKQLPEGCWAIEESYYRDGKLKWVYLFKQDRRLVTFPTHAQAVSYIHRNING